MALLWTLFRALVIAIVVATVGELSKNSPRLAALILSLPVITILAFVMSWLQHHDAAVIATLAKETLILVVLGLPLFLPLIYCDRLGIGFWGAMTCGIALATIAMGLWLRFGPGQ